MKTTFISSHAVSNATRMSMAKVQMQLVTAQKEVATGRLADVSADLGYRTGHAVSLRREHASLMAITDTNALASVNMDMTQSVLQGIVDGAQAFVGALIAGRGGDPQSAADIARNEARGALQSLTGALNTVVGGAHLFGGINTSQRVISNFFEEPPAANRRAVDDAFLAAFAVTQTDPAIDAISGADMQTFLDTAFADLFEPAAWKSDWSAAADENMRSRIGPDQLIETSVNANEAAFAKLARSYTMVAGLGVEQLNAGAFQVVLDEAVSLASEAVNDLSVIQARMGSVQERLSDSTQRMSIKINIVTTHINDLEAVDPYEASIRLTSLLTQMEVSYAVTSRIQGLSLLRYL